MNYSVQFCGDPFWDDFRPIRGATTIPVPTDCFAHTVLAEVPCLFFWLLFPVLIFQIKRSRRRPLPWTTLQSMKWLLITILIVDRFILLLAALWEKLFLFNNVPIIDYVYPIVQIITFGALLVAKNECRRAGIHSSGIIFCSWLVFAVCGIPEFYAWITIGSDPTLVNNADFIRYVAYLTYYPLVLLILFLHCFADPLNIFSDPGKCPEQKASFLNRQTMWWFSPLVATGKKKPLEVDDLFELDENLHADYLTQKWQREWDKNLREYEIRKAAVNIHNRIADDAKSPLLEKKATKGYGTSSKEKEILQKEDAQLPSIIKTLWSLFKFELLGASALKLFCDLLQYANPGFLNLLITWTEDPNAAWYLGILYAVCLFLAAELRSLFMSNYTNESIRVATAIQTVLTTAVYDKTLRLSNAARRQRTQGEIVNLMAIDVDRFRMITPQLQQYWSSPMQIIICLFLLSQTIGYSVVAGVLVMVLIIPVNWKVSSISKRWTLQQMKLKDERIRLSNEVLSGIKVVKLYGWEPALEKSIDEIREKEMSLVRKAAVVKTCADLLNVAAPFFVALASFTTYVLSSPSHVLTPQVAFVSITLFNQLRGPLLMAADLVQQTIQCIVSNKRLKTFLVSDELSDLTIDQEDKGDYYETSVEVDSALFTWEKGSPFQTTEIPALKIGRGELIAVIGSVAAGKSSLLNALLGEMDKLRGYVGVRGLASYVAQQPWIQNRTLRENILMNKPYSKILYDEVVEACALKADLENLPSGDMTEIGEKGINLSGGQKARVALARAVYQDRDVYLLDDPLSAVDAHVARHIFEHVIGPNGILAKKTRILVTHGISFLKECDRIAVMKNGIITHVDTYDILSADDETAAILKEVTIEKSEEQSSTDSSVGEEPNADDELDETVEVKSQLSRVSKRSRKTTKASLLPTERHKLIEKEKAETGRVKFSIYTEYFHSMGVVKYFIPFLICLVLNGIGSMSRQLWLTDWSNDNTVGADASQAMPVSTRLLVYAGIGIAETLFLYGTMISLICGGVAASIHLHRPLLHNILRSPLSYFDVTPLGRILNRLGKDMELIDLRLSSNMRFLAIGALNVIQTCIIISISTPLFIVVIIPIFIIYFLILRHFIDSSRQLQRLASLARSPIYSHFGDTIQGAATIRAFRWSESFKKQNKEKLETYVRCSYFSMLSNRWLSIRLELLGNFVIFATAMLAVFSKNWDSMSAGVIGLTVSYSLNITFMLNMFVRQVSEVETNIVAVERIKEYTITPTEAAWKTNRSLPVGWPAKGRVVFRDYSTRYRPGLELVLKNLSINVAPGQKIGVVGRTGAGKSSLALALFRIVEPASGQIFLDDVDIAAIGLHDLRQNITIIPQDPVLFSGTLRFNLDPTGLFDDAALWSALELSNLRSFVDILPDGLEHKIDEGGDNISVGQRQLVCLTRALLRKSKVLVLDEATAAVDQHTDALIQATIKKEFGTSTVITIAHRLNTIMDYDKVLVMDRGQAAEYASPQELLADKKSQFFAMAQSAKLV